MKTKLTEYLINIVNLIMHIEDFNIVIENKDGKDIFKLEDLISENRIHIEEKEFENLFDLLEDLNPIHEDYIFRSIEERMDAGEFEGFHKDYEPILLAKEILLNNNEGNGICELLKKITPKFYLNNTYNPNLKLEKKLNNKEILSNLTSLGNKIKDLNEQYFNNLELKSIDDIFSFEDAINMKYFLFNRLVQKSKVCDLREFSEKWKDIPNVSFFNFNDDEFSVDVALDNIVLTIKNNNGEYSELYLDNAAEIYLPKEEWPIHETMDIKDDLISDSWDFDEDQLYFLLRGCMDGVDVSVYADPKFDWEQMAEILQGLDAGVDVSWYAKPEFNEIQMDEICRGLKAGLNVSCYAKPEFNSLQMSEIRRGLEQGLDVSWYAKPEFDWEEMIEIRRGLEKGLDVSLYAKPEFDADQMSEILEGVEASVDVSIYAKSVFNFLQMSEIRRGLEKGLDVSEYADPNISEEEMKEIRLELLQQQEEMSM